MNRVPMETARPHQLYDSYCPAVTIAVLLHIRHLADGTSIKNSVVGNGWNKGEPRPRLPRRPPTVAFSTFSPPSTHKKHH